MPTDIIKFNAALAVCTKLGGRMRGWIPSVKTGCQPAGGYVLWSDSEQFGTHWYNSESGGLCNGHYSMTSLGAAIIDLVNRARRDGASVLEGMEIIR